MSDTPRTDAFLQRDHVAWDGMWIAFARELERENAALRSSEITWAASSDAHSEIADGLSADINRLRDEIERWRDSNNRLRAEMEHQARMAVKLRMDLQSLAYLSRDRTQTRITLRDRIADILSPNVQSEPTAATARKSQ